MFDVIESYFPDLKGSQFDQLHLLVDIFREWNEKINLVSRKDIDEFELHHLLHSMSLAIYHSFEPGSRVLDVGTGGGLPGLPLAILFPECRFFLCDSIGKKVKVVRDMKDRLGLGNVEVVHKRAERLESKWDFILGRAVAALPKFLSWISDNCRTGKQGDKPLGVLYFKGSLYQEELASLKMKPYSVIELLDYYPELDYYKEKYLVHLTAQEVQRKAPRLLG